jgi:acyl-CoA reductase-like NAD-dependent aldehyde dehydrogenase
VSAPKPAIRSQAFIDGEFAPAADGRTFATVSPRDGRKLAHVARGGREDIDRAVRAARRAFERGGWALADPAQRGRVLVALADLIVANLEQLALLESLDTGHGRDRSLHALDAYTQYKTTWISLA